VNVWRGCYSTIITHSHIHTFIHTLAHTHTHTAAMNKSLASSSSCLRRPSLKASFARWMSPACMCVCVCVVWKTMHTHASSFSNFSVCYTTQHHTLHHITLYSTPHTLHYSTLHYSTLLTQPVRVWWGCEVHLTDPIAGGHCVLLALCAMPRACACVVSCVYGSVYVCVC
jgi:hypothetical protein